MFCDLCYADGTLSTEKLFLFTFNNMCDIHIVAIITVAIHIKCINTCYVYMTHVI